MKIDTNIENYQSFLKSKTQKQRNAWCAKWCTAKLGWNDRKRAECHGEQACQQFRDWITGKTSAEQKLKDARHKLELIAIEMSEDNPIKDLALVLRLAKQGLEESK